jgi:hypothetical protein
MKTSRMVTVSWPYTQVGDTLVSDEFPHIVASIDGDLALAVCGLNLMIDRHINMSTPRQAFVSATRVEYRHRLNSALAMADVYREVIMEGNHSHFAEAGKQGLHVVQIPLAA